MKNELSPIKALIIDDEKAARDLLESLLHQFFPHVNVVGKARNLVQAAALIHTEQPDLVFLDIHLEENLGFDLFNQFTQPDFEVIFTTAYDKYALKAIKVSALDYLVKPLQVDELETALIKFDQRPGKRDLSRQIELLTAALQPAPQKKIPHPHHQPARHSMDRIGPAALLQSGKKLYGFCVKKWQIHYAIQTPGGI